MQAFYRVSENRLTRLKNYEEGCLISLCSPSEEEVAKIRSLTGISESILADALDPGEIPRMDVDNSIIYFIFRAPWVEGNEERDDFTTPISLIFTDRHTLIIAPHECRSLEDFFSPAGTRHLRDNRARIMACLFRSIANRYLLSLEKINSVVRQNEKRLGDEKRQTELLYLQNCLTYFEAALHGNELTLERIERSGLKLESQVCLEANSEDLDFFDEILTNIRQALYTAHIYAEVMDSLMRAHNATIGARVNAAMKILTSLTLVLMLPTLITSIYGMNVPLPFADKPHTFAFIALSSVVISAICLYFLWKKGWFSENE